MTGRFEFDPFISLFFSTYNYSGNQPASLISFPRVRINYLDLETKDSNVHWYGNRNQFINDLKNPEILKKALHGMGQALLVNPTIHSIDFKRRFLVNERQQKQKGCFMIYRPNHLGGPRVEPLEEMICSGFYNPPNRENLVKPTSIEISSNIIPDIIKNLERRNISKKELGL